MDSNDKNILYNMRKKGMGISLLLWFFLGEIGAHDFYLGRNKEGIIKLIMSAMGFILIVIGILLVATSPVAALVLLYIGIAVFGILAIWWLVDLVRMNTIVKRYNERVLQEINSEN